MVGQKYGPDHKGKEPLELERWYHWLKGTLEEADALGWERILEGGFATPAVARLAVKTHEYIERARDTLQKLAELDGLAQPKPARALPPPGGQAASDGPRSHRHGPALIRRGDGKLVCKACGEVLDQDDAPDGAMIVEG